LLQELSAMPGIVSATTSSHQLLSPVRYETQVAGGTGSSLSTSSSANSSPTVSPAISVDREFTGPDYLTTLGIGLVSGRDFTARDDAASAPVAIVNRTLAARLWPGRNAIGRTVYVHKKTGTATPLTVVGVAEDAKYRSVWEEPQPHLYVADWQSGPPAEYLAVRTLLEPAQLAAAIRKAWGQLEPSVSLYDVQTGDERVGLFLTPQRVAAGIFGAFGLLAITLASVGLYSLVAYSVLQQKREIGIRLAIGAPPRSVLAAILRKSMRLTAAGLVVGGVASLLLMRFLATQVKEVSPYDGPTYVLVALAMVSVTGMAALIPARRAMGVDPAIALRAD
jgi:hypothetical protein